MGEVKLSKALNRYKAIMLEIINYFEMFAAVKMATSAGQPMVLYL